MVDLDRQERELLRLVQRNGKLSTQELARRTSMSTSPVWRKLRKLEDAGVITGYVALADPRKLGFNTRAFVHVSLLDHTEETIATFDRFVELSDQVVECCSVTGADDYLLKVVATDPEDLEQFLMRELLGLGIVRSSTTHFVLRQKKYSTALPLPR